MNDLGRRIVAQTFVAEKTTFAAGDVANNKLKSERLKSDPELFEEVILGLARLSIKYNPDLITYVPNGAMMFAVPVAEHLDLPVAHLFREPNEPQPVFRGRMFIRRAEDYRKIMSARRIAIVEDFSRTFSQTAKVLALDGIAERAVGEVSIIHRGQTEARKNIPIDSVSLDEYYLPPQMPDSQLAEFEALAAEVI